MRQANFNAPGSDYARPGLQRQDLWGPLDSDANPIWQIVDEDALTIRNITIEGHVFHSGEVLIEARGNHHQSTAVISGVGTGAFARINELFGSAYFGTMARIASVQCQAVRARAIGGVR